jgi:formate-dependent nitrite reductase membrane component NrfD
MTRQNTVSGEPFVRLNKFDRVVMIVELLLIIVMVIIAGRYAGPILRGWYRLMFWGGAVAVGILVPLWLNWSTRRPGSTVNNPAMLSAMLILFGGALLRISLVQAGQI